MRTDALLSRVLLRTAVLALVATLVPVLQPQAAVAATGPVLPDGFVDEVLTDELFIPTSFDFLPDGRFLASQKAGRIVVVDTDGRKTDALDLTARVNSRSDRGLIDVSAAPDVAETGHVYALYTVDHEGAEPDGDGRRTNRLSRFTLVGDTIDPASEVVILGSYNGEGCDGAPAPETCLPQDGVGHTADAIRWGSAGSMFVSLGDASDFNNVDTAGAMRAQDIDTYPGKILRITPDGRGVVDNPYFEGDGTSIRSKVWAYGFRNPFRFTLRPSNGTPYVGDVGWADWEEIDVADAGRNFGWPCYEGNGRQPGYAETDACKDLYAAGTAVTAPLITYAHDGGASIVGGPFGTATGFPEPWTQGVFYGDFAQNIIEFAPVNADDELTASPVEFASDVDSVVDMKAGPDGDLYYLSIFSGTIHRVRYDPDAPGSGGGGGSGGGEEPTGPTGTERYISDMAWISSSAYDGGTIERDQSWGDSRPGGHRLTIEDEAFYKGIGTHAPSRIEVAVPDACTEFVSLVGIDDEVETDPAAEPASGSVEFSVLGDDGATVLGTSGVVYGNDPARELRVDVAGQERITLAADEVDNDFFDHADWAAARFICPPVDVPLSRLPFAAVENFDGRPVERDRSTGGSGHGGETLTINGVEYATGLGVHAPSAITFDVPDTACTEFVSMVGIDDEVDTETEPKGAATFIVYVDGAEATRSAELTGAEDAVELRADIEGAEQVQLVVDEGEKDFHDHADWAEARFVCSDLPDIGPVVTITSPSPTETYEIGEVITYEGFALDLQDGEIPWDDHRWQVTLLHCPDGDCHLHPEDTADGQKSSFEASDHGDATHYELALTATDADGNQTTTAIEIFPLTATVTLDTVPSGLELAYGARTVVTPAVVETAVGSTRQLAAPEHEGYRFVGWSDDGAQVRDLVIGPDDVALTATYEEEPEPTPPPSGGGGGGTPPGGGGGGGTPPPAPQPEPEPSPEPTPEPEPEPAVACPDPGDPPFDDVEPGTTHADAIACAVEWELTSGATATTYAPGGTLTRDQMATFVARLIRASGGTLDDAPAPFTDVQGNPHVAAIGALAHAGIVSGTTATTYSPRQPVTRAQMASFLIRAYEHVSGEQLSSSTDHFTDDTGSVHHAAINAAAEVGFASGTSAITYEPGRPVRRDQMASFLIRVLDRATAELGATRSP